MHIIFVHLIVNKNVFTKVYSISCIDGNQTALTHCLAARYSLVLVSCSLITEIVTSFSSRALLFASSSESFLFTEDSFN